MTKTALVRQRVVEIFVKDFSSSGGSEKIKMGEGISMEMRELVGQFVERMQVLRHLVPILPDEQLYVRFESDDETALLLIGKESAARGMENDERKTLTVRGSKEALASLLNGELKLQQLVRLREVHVSGSFRQLLLLESLLHLAKPYRDVG
ncbi:hypothetical protein BRO54_3681 [Geobacillus proteiniphilus]|uniref:SCP2 domain-containing protein n=5 Tax=Geobacillus TaxID=129337 RepID=A0A1Q5SK49_9BACL|nr:hypothetical protein BRO54_3681 [Geobacillus proteiniphilus]